ncbi:MAG: hypothetical protein KatS3mg131_3912 [Candidatus Tectimicrobiota bacterium]|nr:MAG: hypothetical protein KatS3mg131_3912 [Candidatus Tectomicrobia bacterium]
MAVVGDKDRRRPRFAQEALQIEEQRLAAGRVEGGKRLVEQQQLGFQGQGARQARALRLAAREAAGRLPLQVGDAQASEPVRDALGDEAARQSGAA